MGLPSTLAAFGFLGPLQGVVASGVWGSQVLAKTSPQFASKMAQGLTKIGKTQVPAVVKQTTPLITGQVGARGLATTLGGFRGGTEITNQPPDYQQSQSKKFQIQPPSTTDNTIGMAQSQMDQTKPTKYLNLFNKSPEELYRASIRAEQAGNANAAKGLKQMSDDEFKYQKDFGTGTTQLELSDAAIKNVADLLSAIRDVGGITKRIEAPGSQTGPITGKLRFSPYATKTLSLQAEIDRVRQRVGKALEGGVLRKEDEEKYKKILPTMDDTEEVAKNKLKELDRTLKDDLKTYIELQTSYGKGKGVENILGGFTGQQSFKSPERGEQTLALSAVPKEAQPSAQKNIPLIEQALKDEGISDKKTLAYALATIEHETAGTFEPIEEYGGRQQARKLGYGGGENYYGRGFIQLTHADNYRAIGQRIGMGDALVKNPALALRPDISAKILAAFFKDRGVAKEASKGNFYAARGPVNGTDKAREIAQIAQRYLKALS